MILQHDDCSYFEWLDLEIPQNQKKVICKLVAEKEMLEGQLKVKAEMEELLKNQLNHNEARVRVSQSLVSDFSRKFSEGQSKNNELQQSINELAEMNVRLGRRTDYLMQEKEKLVKDKRKLEKKIHCLVTFVWFMVGLFLLIGCVLLKFRFQCFENKQQKFLSSM